MALAKDNKMAWGVSLLVFGIIFLVRQMGILPASMATIAFDLRNYPIILGVIFLLFHKNKTIGVVLLIVSVLFRLSDIIRWTEHLSDLIWPILLIIAGGIVIFKAKK
jgi:uncharacterized paraquat-inducible protein A